MSSCNLQPFKFCAHSICEMLKDQALISFSPNPSLSLHQTVLSLVVHQLFFAMPCTSLASRMNLFCRRCSSSSRSCSSTGSSIRSRIRWNEPVLLEMPPDGENVSLQRTKPRRHQVSLPLDEQASLFFWGEIVSSHYH